MSHGNGAWKFGVLLTLHPSPITHYPPPITLHPPPITLHSPPSTHRPPPIMSNPDPRIFFAAERTLLAWSRTALGVIGLGFVVARFGLFLRLIHAHSEGDTAPHLSAVVLGVALSLVGATISALAAWQYARFYRTLGSADLPPGYWMRVGPVFGYGVAAAGVVLAIELVL